MSNFWLAQAQPPPPLQPLPHPEIPEVFIPPVPMSPWVYAGGAAVLLLLLSLVLWLLLRPKAPVALPPKRPWGQAMNGLKNLASRARSMPTQSVSAEVSEILRRYFMERYNIPAPFRTTHEIFESEGIPQTSPRLHKYAALANLWDELSFAPAPQTGDEVMELLAKAMTHLEEDRL
jgi:hypothetical protein